MEYSPAKLETQNHVHFIHLYVLGPKPKPFFYHWLHVTSPYFPLFPSFPPLSVR